MRVEDDWESVVGLLSKGEIALVKRWRCEGIEMPWGFGEEVLERVARLGSTSGTTFRALTRRNRMKLEEGDVAVVLSGPTGSEHAAIDDFYLVLVRGQRLCVHSRFLRRA